MKKSHIIKLGIFIMGVFLYSCEKRIIDTPNFDVQTDATSYKVGQEVNFKFTGDAKNIVFWSGEKGKNYGYKDRTEEKGVLQTITFTTQAGAGTQNTNLAILLSSDFNGTYDSTSIAKATWVDITGRSQLSSTATAAAGAAKLSIDTITNLGNAENKPVYFAFRYVSQPNTLIPRKWTVSTFTVVNTLADGTVSTVIPSFNIAWFTGINKNDTTYQWRISPAKTSMKLGNFAGTSAPPMGAPANEDWAISAPVKLNKVSLVDYGTSVTSISTLSPPNNFIYKFTAAGTYKVVFYAFNEDINDTKGLTKELTIAITP
jgi:hypothetical protein